VWVEAKAGQNARFCAGFRTPGWRR